MAKNDVVLLDGVIDARVDESASSDRAETFEAFALEQILKDYDLSSDEIESGWVDGGNDGGIDGAFIFINGHLLLDATDFPWPRTSASVDVWLITVKHHATFQQAPLDSMLATVQELFDLAMENDELKGTYSSEVLTFRTLLSQTYRRVSISRPAINFHVRYVSRGDTDQVGESVRARAMQLESTICGLFSSSGAKFQFVGAAELVQEFRKAKSFSLDLPFVEHLATGRDSYVLLVRLADYVRFVTDECGQLRRYLFDSNVRDFLGDNEVNDEIDRSLADPLAPDFWWLNNGVTVLATNATVPGKTIQLQNIQIVNGLQTTETVFRHFQTGATTSSDRCLLVKIVVSSDAQVRDRIIRATNNQSPVEVAALRATDKIQRDIEEILERHEWYYERRKNYYRNIGKPLMRFVTPVYLASAVVALIFKNPQRATRLRPKFMRNQAAYESVFSQNFPVEVWPVLVEVYKRTDSWLSKSARKQVGERFVIIWRPLVALLAVAKAFGTFAYSVHRLKDLAGAALSDVHFSEIWEIVRAFASAEARPEKPRSEVYIECCRRAADQFCLGGVQGIGVRDFPSKMRRMREGPLSDEFIAMVNDVLPPQPWRAEIHHQVAEVLNSTPTRVSNAIRQLIVDGKRFEQRDGIVFASDGRVIMVDPERVPWSVEQLNQEGNLVPEDRG
ncbi:AIPR family protein [Peristeroidobacter agariperforans]|uniref:AIPR family protein n=1 Tax=Peristeroidobacter agariperforans TaxID=268404 RepID=UPI00101C80C0|nr:AIPR family protein [Peristeroidobacter agariperforans]